MSRILAGPLIRNNPVVITLLRFLINAKKSNQFQFCFIRFYIMPKIWLVGLYKTFKS